MIGSHRLWTPGELDGSTIPSTGVVAWELRITHPLPRTRGTGCRDQTPGQRHQNVVEVIEHEPELLHVHPTHLLGQTGGCRLLANKVGRCLRSVAQWELRRREELGRLLDHRHEVRNRQIPEDFPRPLGFPHVPATRPGFAWLTSATGSPVSKWTTWSSSRLLYGLPHRRIGKWIT